MFLAVRGEVRVPSMRMSEACGTLTPACPTSYTYPYKTPFVYLHARRGGDTYMLLAISYIVKARGRESINIAETVADEITYECLHRIFHRGISVRNVNVFVHCRVWW